MAKNSAADRRNSAREQARQIAAAQAKKEKRVKAILYVGIAAVVVAVVAVVGSLVWQSSRPVAPPQNMVSGAVALAAGDDGVQAVQPQGEPEEGADVSNLPTAAESGAADSAPVVKVYMDFQCPGCAAFEQTNGETLNRLAADGSVIVEYEPVALLDRSSGGNEFSTRSANMMACIADSGQTELFSDVSLALFSQQPEQGGNGMEDDQLMSIAESAGVDLDAPVQAEESATVRECVTNVAYDRYVERNTQTALDDENLAGTPYITIDGEPYEGDWSNREGFATDLIRASGQN